MDRDDHVDDPVEEEFAGGSVGVFLHRYQPFIVTVVAIFLIAVFFPGEREAEQGTTSSATNAAGTFERTTGGSSLAAPSESQSLPGADTEVRGSGVASVPGSDPSADAVGAATEAEQLVENCDPETGRIMIPSFSAPPCVQRFSGSNGGSTYQGVTEDTIKVAVYMAQSNPAANAILAAAGANDSREEVEQQHREWAEFYESHFNTWGRKVELHFVDASGGATDDAAGKADAIRVAEQIGAFASLGSPNNTYVNELVARGVMCFCTVELPNHFYQRWAPHVWSTLQSADQTYQLVTEWLVKRMAGRNAAWAGDPAFQQSERKFGLLQYDTTDFAYKSAALDFEKQLERQGIDLLVLYFNGYPDLAANQEQARPLIQRLVEEGITSVICGCDPFAPIFFTQEATRQLYLPEWLVVGSALTDTAFFGRTYDQEQWAHAFGLGQLATRTLEEISDSFLLYMWHFDREPTARAGYAVIRAPIHLFYQGVHMAGPTLTPQSFQTGMFNLPVIEPGKTVVGISFGDKVWPFKDYTAFDDVVEIWWDREAQGPDEIGNDGVGLYRYVNGGQRYMPGDFPSGPPKMFDPEGTVLIYEERPAGEVPPDYPPPEREE